MSNIHGMADVATVNYKLQSIQDKSQYYEEDKKYLIGVIEVILNNWTTYSEIIKRQFEDTRIEDAEATCNNEKKILINFKDLLEKERFDIKLANQHISRISMLYAKVTSLD